MTELQAYQRDPNEELLDLGPADEDVMHWRAVMKGVQGTAYEGLLARHYFLFLSPLMQSILSFKKHKENPKC